MSRFLGVIGFAVLIGGLFFYFWLLFTLPKLIHAHDPRCDGPARYEAMREAYEAGRKQPC